MAQTVGDHILQRLREWDVDRIFGYAGDGINGILAAFGRADNDPRFIETRHEEMAAFAATGYSKFTGKVGVCMATSGPGAIHLLNGLYDAKLDHVPVVAIVGQQARTALGGSYQQEVDLQTLFKDVAAEYVHTAMVPAQFPNLIDRAMRTAMAERTVTAVIVPADLQETEYSAPEQAFKMVPSSMGFSPPEIRPPEDEIDRAAQIINEGSEVAILVGQGARDAADEVVELAERVGGGIAKALLAKDVIPDDLPFCTGPVGLLGSRPTWDMFQACDTFVMIGSSMPYSQFLPPFDQARGVQIDLDPKFIGMRYPMESLLVGDARLTLQALLPKLQRKDDRSFRDDIEQNVSDWWATMQRRANTEADPVNPQRLFWELSPRLPQDVIVTGDSGSTANWYARYLVFRKGMRGSLSGTLATMGPGMPYAVGAKFGHPDRPVIACVGDGAFQMNGMNELITVSKYWQEWDDPRFIVLILHNNDLNQVTWEMRAMGGFPKFEQTQVLPSVNYADYAKLLGLDGIRVEKPDDIAPAWDRALAAQRPTVIDALCDPEVPPIPPHATPEQIKEATQAVLKGDPDAWHLIKTGAKQKVQEFLPGASRSS
ncbi:MAG: thiamine pyrophosphate-requiring protein [Actinobacteria bacterium]|nr:thiamine pyrophosphate-requiring protein [Actinomycetota bacterium]